MDLLHLALCSRREQSFAHDASMFDSVEQMSKMHWEWEE